MADPLLTPPFPSPRRRVRVHITRQASRTLPERLTCRICGFPGIDVTTDPGENFPTALVVTGSRYTWASPSDSIAVIDKAVMPTTNPSVSCSFCGVTRFLNGMKGQGQ